MHPFEVLYHPEVFHQDIAPISRDMRRRLRTAIDNRLVNAPFDYGKPLRGELKSLWSLRVGDYRVLYRIEARKVKVIQIVHRRDAYRAGILV